MVSGIDWFHSILVCPPYQTMVRQKRQIQTSSILFCISIIILESNFYKSNAVLFKCCDTQFVLDDTYKCIEINTNNTILAGDSINNTYGFLNTCANEIDNGGFYEVTGTKKNCTDMLMNGTVVTLSCDKVLSNQTYGQCDSVFKLLNFWGATMVIFATMIYTTPYIILVIVYCSYPDLRKRAYDKSLICYNSSYAVLNSLIIIIGWFELCHEILPGIVYGILGLVIVYCTQASCLWLFVLCFDMTLVITRFRWAPASNSKARSENRKFRIYSICVWGLSAIPTIIATIGEFAPLPEESPIKSHFSDFHSKTIRISLLIYTLTIPVLSLLTNTGLFIYTTYRMVKVQRDNEILNRNKIKKAKKRYFLYLKLYLIMDAPWLSGALSAIFPSLWVLKFVRIIQPIIMLYIILPKKRLLQTIGCIKKNVETEAENRLNNANELAKDKIHTRKTANGNALL